MADETPNIDDEKTEEVVVSIPKTKLYIAIACGVVALILIAVVAFTMFNGGDPTAAAGGVGAAAAAAAEAERRRRKEAREAVEKAKADAATSGAEIERNQNEADADAKAVEDEVAKADDENLEKDGEDLFDPRPATP